ncbi:MAG: hypothetical protein M3P18_19535 [Actinomycetota bacterium]|nr:hypothetical protein [Actinomycetota bacterium]
MGIQDTDGALRPTSAAQLGKATDSDAAPVAEDAVEPDVEGHMPMHWSNRDLKEDIEPLAQPQTEPAAPVADASPEEIAEPRGL